MARGPLGCALLLVAAVAAVAARSCFVEDLRTGPKKFFLPADCTTLLGLSTIDDGRAVALAEHLPGSSVDHLEFKANSIGAVGAAAIAEAIAQGSSAMRSIDLSGNPVGEGGAIALASVLQEDRAALSDLFLSGTTDGEGLDSGPPIGDRGAMAIAVALRSNTRLRTLDLRDQHISTQGALALGDMLRTNTHLELLTLSENPIGFQGVRAIAAGLQNNTALHGLFLSRCGLGDAGAREVAKMLKVNTHLTSLGIWSNEIGDTGATALGEALAVHPALSKLDLDYNYITHAGAVALGMGMYANPAHPIRLLSLESNPKLTEPWQKKAFELAFESDPGLTVLCCEPPPPKQVATAPRFVFLMMLAICAAFLVPFALCSRTAHEDPTLNHGHDLAAEESVVVAAPAAGRQGRGRVKIAPLPAGPSSAGVQLSGGPVVGATGKAVLF